MTNDNVIPFPNQKTSLQLVEQNRAQRKAREAIIIKEIEELKSKLGESERQTFDFKE